VGAPEPAWCTASSSVSRTRPRSTSGSTGWRPRASPPTGAKARFCSRTPKASNDRPLIALSPEIPSEVALQGFDEVRAYTREPERSRGFLEETLGFEGRQESGWEVRGEQRGGRYVYDEADSLGTPGAGTVHHVAFASLLDDHEAWQQRVSEAGAHPTPVIDRFYFRSIYFREPSGVLFEIATIGPGFDSDEPKETLGERLSLPPAFEHLREQIEPRLTPIPNPRKTAEVSR
jgi:glyoxalase family protein